VCDRWASPGGYCLSGALLLVLAICGLHFTAMAAIALVPDPSIALADQIIEPKLLAITVAAVTILIITLALVGNAVKFTTIGHVALEVTIKQEGDAAHLLEFSVSDTGIGIPEAARATMFEKFHQVDNSITRRFGGTGLSPRL
jgi:signal transduction histidine kinase